MTNSPSAIADIAPAAILRGRPKVVSLSLVYPNPEEPGLGLFVRERLRQVGEHVDLRVIAPVPVLDYSNPKGHWTAGSRVPRERHDGALRVYHPSWLYPPGGTPVNLACLYARTAGLLARLRPEFPFDLIDAHFGYPEGVVAAMLAQRFQVPFQVTLRGSELVFARYRYRAQAMRWALLRARQVITVSSELKQFALDSGVPPERVTTIPNGIDAHRFRLQDRQELRQKLGLSGQVILTAGELIEAKGHHLIIEAVASLAREGSNVSLLICGGVARGGRPFDCELRKLVEDRGLAGKVQLLGWQEPAKLAEYMGAADVFSLASMTEGWPNVVHEAIACGTPVVATRVGAVPEMIPSDRFGLIVPPNDVPALQAALARALATSWNRHEISEFGQSRSWARVGQEVGKCMADMLSPAV